MAETPEATSKKIGITINGQRVMVDEAFKSLSPDEQNTVVDEIAKGLKAREPSVGEAGLTWAENFTEGIPVVGPLLQKGSDYVGTEVMGRLTGQDPEQMRADIQKRRERRDEKYPLSSMSGSVGGALAATGAAGATAGGARALGITGESLLGRIIASATTGAAISGADTVVRGGDAGDVVTSMTIGGGAGAAIPAGGAVVKKGLEAIADRAPAAVQAIMRGPDDEAARRIGTAVERDRTTNPGSVVSEADERVARETGVPLLNVDRGGETTRAVARSVANQSPEARAAIEKTASDRFAGQGGRATRFLRKMAGSNVDDLAAQDAVREAARRTNKPAYDKAFASERAQKMWNEGFEQLMQAPALQKAAREATTRGANRSAVEGFQPVKNPFETVDGRLTLRKNADGSTAYPTLQFWDQVKRNLDDQIGAARASGNRTLAGDLQGIKSTLVKMLDDAVPDYQTARQGAAAFFGAEDALDAGRKFANSPRTVPEAKRAWLRMSEPEKELFRVGYASELIDRIKATSDRTNVINQVFKSDASRESMEMVFGKQHMRELEAYIRVEDIADKLRGAMGNSTTVRQLAEAGLAGGAGGYVYSGGDWRTAATTAAAAAGGRYALNKANQKVLERMGEMLISDDPKVIERAVRQAAVSPTFMRSLEQWDAILAPASRVPAVTAGQPQ